jgi:hypothetical protein
MIISVLIVPRSSSPIFTGGVKCQCPPLPTVRRGRGRLHAELIQGIACLSACCRLVNRSPWESLLSCVHMHRLQLKLRMENE